MIEIFDMDGTLVDTFVATRIAYDLAGYPNFGPEWGRSAKDWGCPEDIHLKKQEIFPSILKDHAMPSWAFDRWLASKNRVLLTGATLPTVLSVAEAFPQLDLRCARIILGCSLDDKIAVISGFAKEYSVRYYEDNEDVASRIRHAVPRAEILTERIL